MLIYFEEKQMCKKKNQTLLFPLHIAVQKLAYYLTDYFQIMSFLK